MGEITDEELINDYNTQNISDSDEQQNEAEGSELAGSDAAPGGTGSGSDSDDNGSQRDGDGSRRLEADEEGTDTDAEKEHDDADEDEYEDIYLVKVDGVEIEVTEDELLRGYSTNKSAQTKFQEAAMARKQAEEFISMLKTDPWRVLNNPDLGLDTRAMAESYLAQQIEFDQLSDNDRELIQARNQLHEFELQRQQIAQQEHDANVSSLESQYREEYEQRIDTALSGSGLPQTENSVRRLASYMSEALNSDDPAIQNLTDQDLCILVREDLETDFRMMFADQEADNIVNFLGDDIAKIIRKADVAKLKGKTSIVEKPVKGNGKQKSEDKGYMSTDDFEDYLDNLM